MTQTLFDQVIACAEQIEKSFRESGEVEEVAVNEKINARDVVFSSLKYRRAHISTVDARETKKLYLLHVTIFPHLNDPSPIYGFDIVCGPTKVSGAFHDFSIAGDHTSPMWLWFNAKVANLEWNKPRELPDWGKQIFSKAMVAIGAVGEQELDEFIKIGLETLKFYIDNVGINQQDVATFEMAQNRYCHYQKQNPRTPASLQHLGFTEQECSNFIHTMLFPEIG
jgi:hypothetical protein